MSLDLPKKSYRNVIAPPKQLGGVTGDPLNTERLVLICPCCGRPVEEKMGFVRCRCGNVVHDNSKCSVQIHEQLMCKVCFFQNVPLNDQRYFVLTSMIIEPKKDAELHELIGTTKRQLKTLRSQLEDYGLTFDDRPTPLGRMVWESLSRIYCRRRYVVDILNQMGLVVHV